MDVFIQVRNTNATIGLYSGGTFDILNPRPEDVRIKTWPTPYHNSAVSQVIPDLFTPLRSTASWPVSTLVPLPIVFGLYFMIRPRRIRAI